MYKLYVYANFNGTDENSLRLLYYTYNIILSVG